MVPTVTESHVKMTQREKPPDVRRLALLRIFASGVATFAGEN
jgi:hypothetical protein